ncbi:hypothetical protein VOLCADRAFT_104260 [Volvox carteri f. nagariensis]|uniref:Uncharacterized protein n=1 Tax=Volvox carteri f. nagariensis TaxID=3068 RepID=D8TSF1_VOLCA|nr:uncharacterized protein VOLCADRAFT_104260 [Volvox carteri f. nagariensis]EFJ49810.1 hypothetical protein VOLCADRAFT_104260 [Volvox carteri f. nagariensis]|eukprot:XP_002949317.1 hypothetical protein VOLCADRAFT_104260 [Volvox carteri f. nagariensis]
MTLCTLTKSASRVGIAARGSRRLRSSIVCAEGVSQRLSNPIVLPSGAELKPMTVKQAMTFMGPAPELINARLAMLGVVGAVGAEVTTGKSVLAQFAGTPLPVLALVLALSGATLAPIVRGANLKEAFGPLTPQAELVNGRLAMLALAALLALEVSKGSALL